MDNLNKITHTKVGDNIHYYTNGIEGRGVIVKMSNAYVSVLKDSGNIDEIHINDTFFVKDIITNKSWNDMDLEERVVELQKAHAFSPRFVSKTWEELPPELRDVLSKSNLEESTHGQIGGNRAGVSTKIPFDAEDDYEGESDDDKKEEFKHEHQEKPKVDKNKDSFSDIKEPKGGTKWQVRWTRDGATGARGNWRRDTHDSKEAYDLADTHGGGVYWTDNKGIERQAYHGAKKNNGMEEEHKKKEQTDGMRQDWRPTGGESDKNKNFVNKISVRNFVNTREGLPSGGDIKPISTPEKKLPSGNAPTKAPKDAPRVDERDETDVTSYGNRSSNQNPKGRGQKKLTSEGKLKSWEAWLSLTQKGYNPFKKKQGDGAGTSGINSTDTVGVYNARYSDKKGRYRDQGRDGKQ